MLNLFRPRKLHLVIDNGRVACPLRGRDVEIDLCTGCRWLCEFDETGASPAIGCRPDLPPFGLLRMGI